MRQWGLGISWVLQPIRRNRFCVCGTWTSVTCVALTAFCPQKGVFYSLLPSSLTNSLREHWQISYVTQPIIKCPGCTLAACSLLSLPIQIITSCSASIVLYAYPFYLPASKWFVFLSAVTSVFHAMCIPRKNECILFIFFPLVHQMIIILKGTRGYSDT